MFFPGQIFTLLTAPDGSMCNLVKVEETKQQYFVKKNFNKTFNSDPGYGKGRSNIVD